jgi:hypothetical protein
MIGSLKMKVGTKSVRQKPAKLKCCRFSQAEHEAQPESAELQA